MTAAARKPSSGKSEAARAEYTALVFAAVEHPDVPPADKVRIHKILTACGKTSSEVLADVDRVRRRHDVHKNLQRAEEAAVKMPELRTALRAAEARSERLTDELRRKVAAETAEINRLGDEISMTEKKVLLARLNAANTLVLTAPWSTREVESNADWRSIDLFSSGDPPVRIKMNQQPSSNRNARPTSTLARVIRPQK
jgi:hypothetical protein